MCNPIEVAGCIVLQLEEWGELRQQDAPQEIRNRFGEGFVNSDRNSDLAISRKVLYRFKKPTDGCGCLGLPTR